LGGVDLAAVSLWSGAAGVARADGVLLAAVDLLLKGAYA
jgi:hypothetical protein